MNDELGNRMKDQYEDRTRYLLPRRTYTVIRVDGKAFHTLTKGFQRPFDRNLMSIMDKTAIALCSGIQGALMAYTQSDEISIILSDFSTPNTCAWFDGNIQKIVSISASIATLAFNKALKEAVDNDAIAFGRDTSKYYNNKGELKEGHFDARVFTIPDPVEVRNYLIWRQQDATRNSVQMVARSLYSHKECDNKSGSELQEASFKKGVNWNDFASGEKRGRAIVKEKYTISFHPGGRVFPPQELKEVERTRWVALTGIDGDRETPIFSQDKEFLEKLIPVPWGNEK